MIKMGKLEEVRNDFLTGEMFGKQWCSISKSNFEWLIEQAEKLEKYQKEIEQIAGLIADLMFAYMNKDNDLPHDFELLAFEAGLCFLKEHYTDNKYNLEVFEKELIRIYEIFGD